MAKKADADLQYTLLENGLDFIDSGLRLVTEVDDPSDLKYAVLHLGAGIELVLKERLRIEDWRLLFQNPEQASEMAYEAGNFSSVRLDECLKRLQKAHVNIPAGSRNKLTAFYHRRNRIQHFRFLETQDAIESAAANAIGIILDFIADQLPVDDFTPEENELLASIRGRVADFERFTAERMTAIEPRLKEGKGMFGGIVCPSCLQDTLSADCDVECPFCGYRDTAEKAADLYISNVLGVSEYSCEKDGDPYPRSECPNCDNAALVETNEYTFLCFACGFTAELGPWQICQICGQLRKKDGFLGDRCSVCDADYLAQDNT